MPGPISRGSSHISLGFYSGGMKHLTYADKSVLVGDEAADVIIEFSALLAETGHADAVVLHAIGSDGDEVTASFVLGSGTNLMAETTTSRLPEPNNTEMIAHMRGKIALYGSPPKAGPDTDTWPVGDEYEAFLENQ
jgi:hypothetical protein